AGRVGATLWLLVVVLPLYYILVTSLRTPDGYLNDGALALPGTLTLDNYGRVLGQGFARLLVNSAVVTPRRSCWCSRSRCPRRTRSCAARVGPCGSGSRSSCSAWPSPPRPWSSRST
ncbi:hypothetical protein JNW89_33800, partial [Micromonospora sp. 4G55]|nr:hypothetical protein [Micromonospora sp. 4G55]